MILPKKRLGQHFLKDRRVLEKIIKAAELNNGDTVLEIGAGTGFLTEALAERAGLLIAVEKDPELCEALWQKISSRKNVEIVCKDALRMDLSGFGLKDGGYKIVANIPYFITGRILRNLCGEWPMPELAVLMVQKEVAERLTAEPPKMNRLAAIVRLFAEPKIVFRVPGAAFRPSPKVKSALIKLTMRPIKDACDKNRRLETIEIMRLGFSNPRKVLAANLSVRYPKEPVKSILRNLGISESARAQELGIAQWLKISTALRQNTL